MPDWLKFSTGSIPKPALFWIEYWLHALFIYSRFRHDLLACFNHPMCRGNQAWRDWGTEGSGVPGAAAVKGAQPWIFFKVMLVLTWKQCWPQGHCKHWEVRHSAIKIILGHKVTSYTNDVICFWRLIPFVTLNPNLTVSSAKQPSSAAAEHLALRILPLPVGMVRADWHLLTANRWWLVICWDWTAGVNLGEVVHQRWRLPEICGCLDRCDSKTHCYVWSSKCAGTVIVVRTYNNPTSTHKATRIIHAFTDVCFVCMYFVGFYSSALTTGYVLS